MPFLMPTIRKWLAITIILPLFFSSVQGNSLYADTHSHADTQRGASDKTQVDKTAVTISNNTVAVAGVTPIVRASVMLQNNSESVAAGFSIIYDNECLSFIDSDADQNGIRDGLNIPLPDEFSRFFNYDGDAQNGQLDFILADLLPPYRSLPDGALLELTFIPTCYPDEGESYIAPVQFRRDPSPIFSNAIPQALPIVLTDGQIEIASPTSGTALLPPTQPGTPPISMPPVSIPPVTPLASNIAPVAIPDEFEMEEDSTIAFDPALNDTDSDGGSLAAAAIIVAPSNGIAMFQDDGKIHYQPNPNFFGRESIVYLLTDGQGGTTTGAITITVNPVNDPPTFVNIPDELTSTEGEIVEYAIQGIDPEAAQDQLSYTIFGLPNGIQFNGTTGKLSGELPEETAGSYEVIVIVSDGELSTSDFFRWVVLENRPNIGGEGELSSQAYLPLFYK